jgi:hypothetical protein
MAEEKNDAQLSDPQLDEANGGRNWFSSEYAYEATNYIHTEDGGKILFVTETLPKLTIGQEYGYSYKCEKCGVEWFYEENTVKHYFTTVS